MKKQGLILLASMFSAFFVVACSTSSQSATPSVIPPAVSTSSPSSEPSIAPSSSKEEPSFSSEESSSEPSSNEESSSEPNSSTSEEKHIHTFSEDWTNDKTYHWHAATCEHTNEKSNKAKHTFSDWTVTKKETVTETGLKERTCSVCGYKEEETIPVHKHTYSSKWSKDDTYHWHVATCEHTDEISAKAAHTFGEWQTVTPATTEETGTKERTCSVCGYKEEGIIPLHVHTYSDDWTSNSTHHWHASTCGHNELIIDKEEHEMIKEVTSYSNGNINTLEYCSTCGYVASNKTEYIGLRYHMYTDEETGKTGLSIYGSSNTYTTATLVIPEKVYNTDDKETYDVIAIEAGAFTGNTTIKNLTIPNTVVYIEEGAFDKNVRLERLTLPFIGTRADNQTTLRKIFNETYYYPNYLRFITIAGDQQKELPASAFGSDSYLYSVDLSNTSIEKIGESAFDNCEHLNNVLLPQTVTEIGANAFNWCSNLKEISFPGECPIPSGVFDEYAKFTNFYYGGDFNSWVDLDVKGSIYADHLFLLDEEGDTEYGGLKYSLLEGEVVIPEGTVTLHTSLLAGNEDVTSVIVPESVTTIKAESLSYITNLDTLEIKGAVNVEKWSINSVGTLVLDHAFVSSVNNLRMLKENGIVYYRGELSELFLSDYDAFDSNPFYAASKIYHLDEDGDILYNDENYSTIDAIEIPDDITEIKPYSLYYFTDITELVIPENIKTIRERSLPTSLTSVTLNEGLETIGSYAFYGSHLSSIYIPSTVKTIDGEAFASSTLDEVIFADDSKLENIGGGAFYNDYKLTEIVIPDSVTRIGSSAFKDTGLKKITLPFAGNSMTEGIFADIFGGINSSNINSNPFPSGLEEVVITKQLDIPYQAFRSLRSLKKLTLPDNVKSFGIDMLFGTGEINDFVISASVKTIGRRAFGNGMISEGQDNIKNIYYQGTINDYLKINFVNGNDAYVGWATAVSPFLYVKNIYILDPDGEIEYDGLKYSPFPTEIIVEEGITTIGKQALAGHTKLTKVVLPSTIETIGEAAFYGCISLEDINFPDGLKTIKSYAFQKCDSLVNAKLPDSVIKTEAGAFKDCAKLEVVSIVEPTGYLKDSITVNDSLKEIIISAPVTSVLPSQLFYQFETANIKVTLPFFGYSPANNKGMFDSSKGLVRAYDFKTIEIAEGITSAPSNAFAYSGYSKQLENVILPKSITSYGANAFNISTLKNIYYNGTYEEFSLINWGTNSDPRDMENITIYYLDEDGEITFYGRNYGPLTTFRIPDGLTEIPANLYKDITGIDSIIIPNSVTTINASSMQGTDVEKVYFKGTVNEFLSIIQKDGPSIPNPYRLYILDEDGEVTYKGLKYTLVTSVTVTSEQEISDYVFNNWILDKIIFEDGRTSLPTHALNNLQAKKLVLPSTLTSLAKGAISSTTLEELEVPFIGASLSATTLENNNTHFGYIFGANTYEDNATAVPVSLRKVTITGEITAMVDYSFYGCNNLEYIYYPNENIDNANKIGPHSFEGCSSLKEFVGFKNMTTSNTSYTPNLSTCTSLTKVTINNSNNTLYGLLGLSSEPNNFNTYPVKSITTLVFGEGVTFINYNAAQYYTAITTLVIPEGVTEIRAYAFSHCSGITELNLPSTLTTFGMEAFNGCSGLTSLVIPENAKTFNTGVFKYCTSLKTVTLPSELTTIASDTFYNCTSLETINIPSTVTSIGSSAFYNCNSLTGVELPSGLKTIYSYAFYNCTFANVEIPASVTTVQTYAFYKSSGGLANVYYDGTREQWLTINTGSFAFGSAQIFFLDEEHGDVEYNGHHYYTFTSYDVEEGTTVMPEGMFKGIAIPNVDSAYIPSTVTEINANVYDGTNVSKIYYGGTLEQYLAITINGSFTSSTTKKYDLYVRDDGGSITYKDYNYSKVQNITITSSKVPQYALAKIKLGSVTLDGVEEIEQYAFAGSSFTSIDFGSNLKIIGNNAFERTQSSLSGDFAIPNTVTTIGSNVFYNTYISTLVVPSSVVNIANEAFKDMTSLQTVEFNAGATVIPNSCFKNCSMLSDFTFEEGVTEIGQSAFEGCYRLHTISFPDSLKVIGYRAFYNTNSMEGLTGINFNKVEKIDKDAFYSARITSIVLPNTIKEISAEAFSNCKSVTSLSVPDCGMTIIKNGNNTVAAFYGIPESVFTVYKGAYYAGNSDNPYLIFVRPITYRSDSSVTSMEIHKDCKIVGPHALYSYSYITSVTFETGSQLEEICAKAFASTHLTTITLPDTLKYIREEAFRWTYYYVGAIVLPNSVISVGEAAFSGCYANSVDLAQVQILGKDAFGGMGNVDTWYLPNTLVTVGPGAFRSENTTEKTMHYSGKIAEFQTFQENNPNWYESLSLKTKTITCSDGPYEFR